LQYLRKRYYVDYSYPVIAVVIATQKLVVSILVRKETGSLNSCVSDFVAGSS
jgi:hypothetical protein